MIPTLQQAAAAQCDLFHMGVCGQQIMQSMILGIGMSSGMAIFWTAIRLAITHVAKLKQKWEQEQEVIKRAAAKTLGDFGKAKQ